MIEHIPDELPHREVFILYIWRFPKRPAAWQAQIQHIGSGKVMRVQTPHELLEYLFQRTPLNNTVDPANPQEPGTPGLK